MDFAQSGDGDLQRISDAAGGSLIPVRLNMPRTGGLELLPKAKAARPDLPVIMIAAYGAADTQIRNEKAGRAEPRRS
jgi:DNA-binding NtrC family response regulator